MKGLAGARTRGSEIKDIMRRYSTLNFHTFVETNEAVVGAYQRAPQGSSHSGHTGSATDGSAVTVDEYAFVRDGSIRRKSGAAGGAP